MSATGSGRPLSRRTQPEAGPRAHRWCVAVGGRSPDCRLRPVCGAVGDHLDGAGPRAESDSHEPGDAAAPGRHGSARPRPPHHQYWTGGPDVSRARYGGLLSARVVGAVVATNVSPPGGLLAAAPVAGPSIPRGRDPVLHPAANVDPRRIEN